MVKAALTLIFGLLISLGASAQQQSDAVNKTARPLWSELAPKQQAVLAPLAAEWDNMDTNRRKKWVAIANRFPKMKADEQQRLQSRMQDWAALTPAQRRVARENFQSLQQLPRAQRGEVKQKWQEHQQSAPPAGSAEAATPTSPGK